MNQALAESPGNRPLHIAVESAQPGSSAGVEALLTAGADPMLTSAGDGVTPLILASRLGKHGAVRALLTHDNAQVCLLGRAQGKRRQGRKCGGVGIRLSSLLSS